jgi:hypothetical protein
VSSDFLKWKDMLTIPLNKPLPPADDSSGQPDLGSAELRLPVLPVGEDLEQKKVEIAVRLSKLAMQNGSAMSRASRSTPTASRSS